MPRVRTTTNYCDGCQRAVGQTDDRDMLDEEDGPDTGVPLWWGEVTIRVKQPNPDYADAESQIKQAVQAAYTKEKPAAEKELGRPLNPQEVSGLLDMLDKQARALSDLDEPEYTIVEHEGILCEECMPLLGRHEIFDLDALKAADHTVAPWDAHAAPAVQEQPAVAPAEATPTVAPPAGPVEDDDSDEDSDQGEEDNAEGTEDGDSGEPAEQQAAG